MTQKEQMEQKQKRIVLINNNNTPKMRIEDSYQYLPNRSAS